MNTDTPRTDAAIYDDFLTVPEVSRQLELELREARWCLRKAMRILKDGQVPANWPLTWARFERALKARPS